MNDVFVHKLIRLVRGEKFVTLRLVRGELKCSCADAFDGIRELSDCGLLEYAEDGKFRVSFDEDKARAFKRNHGIYAERRSKSELSALSKELCSFDMTLLSQIQTCNGANRELLGEFFDDKRLDASLDRLKSAGLVVYLEKDDKYFSTLEQKQREILIKVIIDREAAEEVARATSKDPEKINFDDYDIPDPVGENEPEKQDGNKLFDDTDVIEGILNSLEATKKKKPHDD